MLEIFSQSGLPPGKARETVELSVGGMTTTPDWLYVDPVNQEVKVAVYLDGMSRHLHGDPRQARSDDIIRRCLEIDGYKVFTIQRSELDDSVAMGQHIRNIAWALGKGE